MSTNYADAQGANIAEVLDILREFGATAEVFTAQEAMRLAFVLQGLHAQLATHTIVIAAVPITPSLPHLTPNL